MPARCSGQALTFGLSLCIIRNENQSGICPLRNSVKKLGPT
jgi:hypothetical protein